MGISKCDRLDASYNTLIVINASQDVCFGFECKQCLTHEDCPENLYCDIWDGMSCKEKKDNGSLTHNPLQTFCSVPQECKSGICELGFCRNCKIYGGGCEGDEYCDIYNDCQKKENNGERCLAKAVCLSVSKIERAKFIVRHP